MERIALIAHDRKKDDLVDFVKNHRNFFEKYDLVSTGTTGGRINQATDLEIHRYLSGPLGGDAQIAARVVEGKTNMVFFFRDPMGKHPHEPDVNMLLRLCDVHNIPLATNPATAEMLLDHLR